MPIVPMNERGKKRVEKGLLSEKNSGEGRVGEKVVHGDRGSIV